MTRTAFLAALEQLLAPLPEAERKDALSYYEDYLDTAGPENEARAIAELGSPEEVAHKILDEQTPADNSAAPVSPARKPRSRWRMVLGGGLALLVLVCFFFQHSKATPVQPVESISPASEIPVPSAQVSTESASTQTGDPASASDSLTFSLSAEMASDKLSLELDYGTILFVVDPNVSDITLQFDGFRTRYLTHSNKKDGTAEFSYHIPKYYALCRPGIPCPQTAFPLAHGAGRRAGVAGAGLFFLPALQSHPCAAGRVHFSCLGNSCSLCTSVY